MGLTLFLSLAAAVWWGSSTAVLLLSFVAALLHPLRRRRAGSTPAALTAIVPVKNVHAGFEEAQRSLFSQCFDGLEIIIATHEPESPALSMAQSIGREFAQVPSRVVISDCHGAASPKLNNIWPAIRLAMHDCILTKDSNVCLAPGDAAALQGFLQADVGLVSAIPIATHPATLASWIEASVINCYHARMLMLGDAVGLGFGLGKIMLFRRSDLMRAGGFRCMDWALGEDMALARAMREGGLRTVLADHICHQTLGSRSFSQVRERQLRWMTIWRVQLPAVFIAALFGSALPTAVAGAVAARLLGFSAMEAFAGTLIAWFGIESALCVIKGWPISFWSPLAFLGREVMTLALWLRACATDQVVWAGAAYRVQTRERFRASGLSTIPPASVREKPE